MSTLLYASEYICIWSQHHCIQHSVVVILLQPHQRTCVTDQQPATVATVTSKKSTPPSDQILPVWQEIIKNSDLSLNEAELLCSGLEICVQQHLASLQN